MDEKFKLAKKMIEGFDWCQMLHYVKNTKQIGNSSFL